MRRRLTWVVVLAVSLALVALSGLFYAVTIVKMMKPH